MTDQVTGADSATQTAEPLALRLNDLLGPLPKPLAPNIWGGTYTAEQMQAYALAASKATLDACVEVLDEALMTAELCQAACDSETGDAYYNNEALQSVALCLGECIDKIDGPNVGNEPTHTAQDHFPEGRK